MMSLQAISDLSAEQSAKAAKDEKQPTVLFSEATAIDDIRRIAWIGEYTHPDWRKAEIDDFTDALEGYRYAIFDQDPGIWLFTDKSNLGEPGNPALCATELEDLLPRLVRRAGEMGVTLGVGIVEEGQFQIHVGLYVKD